MKLQKSSAEIFIPNNEDSTLSLKRTTHMAIAAHQDDIEIMAYHGIEACLHQTDQFFTGVVVTNGSGSARENAYQDYTDEDMITVRKNEQKKAAVIGEFSALALLDYPSKEVKDGKNEIVTNELLELLNTCQPEILYTHNLADKHDSHIGVVTKTIKAVRQMPKNTQPKKIYGCEVWRDLDWMNDDEKVMLDVSKHPNLASALVEVFDSQIVGGKRYDKAAIGRRLANATFNSSHSVDQTDAITYAMDLTPLIKQPELDITEYVTAYIDRFKKNVADRIKKVL